MKESGMQLLIFNSPVRELSWFSDNAWGCRFDCLQEEFKKINQYSQLGHLVTYKEAIEYQQWKEKQR